MWTILWFFVGMLRVRITGASPDWALERMGQRRIAVREIAHRDAFTLEATILKRDLGRAQAAVRGAMCELEVTEEAGFYHTFRGALRRPVLFAGLILTVLGAVLLPRFVFFYEVSGNERVPTAVILRELEELGVGFGTFGPNIKPQDIKNQILNRIPELQWLTVQQSGMCARVIVRERPEPEPIYDRKTPGNVIAAQSGVITSVDCMAGNCLCEPGQAVSKGDLLVSAYTDHGFKTQVSAALAEIYAETAHHTVTVTPDRVLKKVPTGRTCKQIALIAGNRRWNIFGKSGFFHKNCDKMTVYHQLQLPGGYFFPFGIAITVFSEYDTEEVPLSLDDAESFLRQDAVRAVSDTMIAGRILDVQGEVTRDGGLFRLASRIRCEEMIARMVPASIIMRTRE